MDSDEWYTPPEWIGRVRTVLRGIDLDPASCAHAQQTVRAAAFFDKDTDGLTQSWEGRVFLNPPYSSPLCSQFVSKLIEEWAYGRVLEAIVLTNSSTETRWYQALLRSCTCIMLPSARIRFLRQDASPVRPMYGSTLFYFGSNLCRFNSVFREHGTILSTRLLF